MSETPEATETPRTPLVAIKTGLTERTMLFSVVDAEIYQNHLDRFYSKYSPVGDDEMDLLQTIVDTNWRILRLAPLEAGIYAVGRDRCAPSVAHETDPTRREGALMAQIYLTYKKDLTSIASEERRLTKQLEKAVTQLEALQKARYDARFTEIDQARKSIEAQKANEFPPDLAEYGFDFSATELEEFFVTSRGFSILSGGKKLNFDQFLIDYRANQAAKEPAAQAA